MPATITTDLTVTPHGTSKTGARLFLVPSRTERNTQHVVAFHNNVTSCDCDGSFYRGRCAHGRAVENWLIAERRNQRPMIDDATRRAAMNMLMAPRNHGS